MQGEIPAILARPANFDTALLDSHSCTWLPEWEAAQKGTKASESTKSPETEPYILGQTFQGLVEFSCKRQVMEDLLILLYSFLGDTNTNKPCKQKTFPYIDHNDMSISMYIRDCLYSSIN